MMSEATFITFSAKILMIFNDSIIYSYLVKFFEFCFILIVFILIGWLQSNQHGHTWGQLVSDMSTRSLDNMLFMLFIINSTFFLLTYSFFYFVLHRNKHEAFRYKTWVS